MSATPAEHHPTMTGTHDHPTTVENLTRAELLDLFLEEVGEIKIVDHGRVVFCPFSSKKKICRIKEADEDWGKHTYYCVETIVVIEEGTPVEAEKSEYCPVAAAANAF